MTQDDYMDYVKTCGHSQSMKRSFTKKEQKQVLKYWEKNKNLSADAVACYFELEFKMPVSCTGVLSALVTKAIGQLK